MVWTASVASSAKAWRQRTSLRVPALLRQARAQRTLAPRAWLVGLLLLPWALLTGCGQKGPLFLSPAAHQASAVPAGAASAPASATRP